MPNKSQVDEVRRALAKVIRTEYLEIWLATPNSAFSGIRPIEMIKRGKVDRLWRMFYELESGRPS